MTFAEHFLRYVSSTDAATQIRSDSVDGHLGNDLEGILVQLFLGEVRRSFELLAYIASVLVEEGNASASVMSLGGSWDVRSTYTYCAAVKVGGARYVIFND